MKLHLGCGGTHLEGYINIDLYDDEGADKLADACDISMFESNTADEIRSHHLIEHLTYRQLEKAFQEWYRVLKSGGLLFIECPNILEICREFVSAPEEEAWAGMPPGTNKTRYGYALIQAIYGNQMGPTEPSLYGFGSLTQLLQTHKSGWTPEYLTRWLRKVGFSRFEDRSSGMTLALLSWK